MFDKETTHYWISEVSKLSTKKLTSISLESFQKAAQVMQPGHIISYFKKYRPLDKGNTKLSKSILSFSLLPVVTCGGRKCEKCYDLKSLRYTKVKAKRIVNTLLAVEHTTFLFNQIIRQANRSRTCKTLRIHVGGDLFSTEYADYWTRARKFIKKEINMYSYTKSGLGETLNNAGINCVNSLLPDGSFNYGPKEKMVAFQTKNPEYFICPTKGCGSTCKECHTNQHILFIQH